MVELFARWLASLGYDKLLYSLACEEEANQHYKEATMYVDINKDGLLTITREGYHPVTFELDGKVVRVVHGVAFKGDHEVAEAGFTACGQM